MTKNLYVGNLPFSTTEEDLRVEFSKHGAVVGTQIIKDRDTGRSRGFGFVEMSEGADAAIAALNGAMFQGRTLTVNEARPREERRGPGGGGGGGGYGGPRRGNGGGYGGGGGGGGGRGPRY
jgi:RNA recognition motif-containing protein